LDTPASQSDVSQSGGSSGMLASGSSGSNLMIWQWLALAGLLFCCFTIAGGSACLCRGGSKKKKEKHHPFRRESRTSTCAKSR
jgi:hypothetical protein